MMEFLHFLLDNSGKLGEQAVEHVGLTFLSLLIAVILAVPLGIWITRKKKVASLVLGFAGILQTIPSIALLGFMIPLLGIGVKPAIFALFLYALLPIIRNTYTGILEVDQSVIESAVGMGMSPWQILWKVELPLSLPVIYAGVRTATVINVGVATLAAYIGAGGLGEFIFGGIALNSTNMILAGAMPAALLAILFDQLLAFFQHQPKLTQRHPALFLLILIPALSLISFSGNILVDDLKAAFDPEFYGRDDGYPALKSTYGVSFNTTILNASLMYEAIKAEKVDVIGGYSTDGRIEAYNLVLLEDNRHAFPPYYCTPVVGQRVKKEYPEVIKALQLLSGLINDSTMRALNYQIDYNNQSVEEVARSFLISKGLWESDRRKGGPEITIGSKIFTEQYLLVEIFSQLINGHTNLDVDARPGLGGTKLCFEALRTGEIDLYPEYTGTGFQVILSPEQNLVKELINDPDAVYLYVKNQFADKYDLHWLKPLGFNNTYALMARQETAQKQGWESIGNLVKSKR